MTDEYRVVAACRSIERGREAFKEEIPMSGKEGDDECAKVDVMECDLASFRSVEAFAEAFTKKYGRLDVLMNNAGIMALPERMESEDGNELQMQTNHLSHFMLTAKLMPLMLATERRHPERRPRVVNVASIATSGGLSITQTSSRRSFRISRVGMDHVRPNENGERFIHVRVTT